MAIQTHDFTVIGGANKKALIFEVLNPDETPQDLTGHDFIFVAKPKGAAQIVHSLTSGGLVLDPDTGRISYRPTLIESRVYPPGRVTPYSVERRMPNGDQWPILAGMVIGVEVPNND